MDANGNGPDVIVIGAGFAGLYALWRLRSLGFRARAFEAGADVGGTWYWNRYPGARCDVESLDYQYSFSDELQREWTWSERFAAQPEILAYAEHVADRFDLRRDITFEARVVRAAWDAQAGVWRLSMAGGREAAAPVLIAATGCLSLPSRPDLPGVDAFEGEVLHTGLWPHAGVDFRGRRVGVIGTGSSAIQSIPVIAEAAEQLYVFQRTPNFSLPAHNRPLGTEETASHKSDFQAIKARARMSAGGMISALNDVSAHAVEPDARDSLLEARWTRGGIQILGAFNDTMTDAAANAVVAEFLRGKIRATVRDPELAERLSPRTYPVGTKRICIDTGYFETFNRENVSLVDVAAAPIAEITRTGLRTTDADYAFDTLVLATGFDAMTGPLLAINPVGEGGRDLRSAWAAGPKTLLGLQTAGFPNLFMITGPGSPSVLTNMIMSIEQHVDWICDLLTHLRDQGLRRAAAIEAAQEAWVEHVNLVAGATLFPQAGSWYMGANIPGKPRVFMPYCGGLGVYRSQCDAVAAAGYDGFSLA